MVALTRNREKDREKENKKGHSPCFFPVGKLPTEIRPQNVEQPPMSHSESGNHKPNYRNEVGKISKKSLAHILLGDVIKTKEKSFLGPPKKCPVSLFRNP